MTLRKKLAISILVLLGIIYSSISYSQSCTQGAVYGVNNDAIASGPLAAGYRRGYI